MPSRIHSFRCANDPPGSVARRFVSLQSTILGCQSNPSGEKSGALLRKERVWAVFHPAALPPANVENGSTASVMHKGTTAPPSAHSLAISPPHWIPSIVAGG